MTMTGTDHKALLNRVLAGKDLSSSEMEAFIGAIMDGGVDDVVVAAMLVPATNQGRLRPLRKNSWVERPARRLKARPRPIMRAR